MNADQRSPVSFASLEHEANPMNRRSLPWISTLCLLLTGCAAGGQNNLAALLGGFGAGANDCGGNYLGSIENSFAFGVNSTAGETTPVGFDVSNPGTPILETRSIEIALPEGFGFMGFYAIGGIGVEIGSFQFDTSNPDGTFDGADVSYPIISIFMGTAYADINDNGVNDIGTDIDISAGPNFPDGIAVFISIPKGGTPTAMNCVTTAADMQLDFFDGIFQMPDTPGDYMAEITAVSIDPDTGDLNDFQGAPQLVYETTAMMTVPEPGATSAAWLALGVLLVMCRRTSR
jgi:hypothetical protein